MANEDGGTEGFKLSGAQRSAILLMYLQRDSARKVLQHLSLREVEDIGRAMAELEHVDQKTVETVVGDFVRELARSAMVPKTGRAFALEILPELVGGPAGQRVGGALRRLYSTEFQEYCAAFPPRTLAALLRDEHPQARAVALMLMGTNTAARVLNELTDDERLDVSVRMARLDGVSAEVADDVERAVRLALDEAGAIRWQVAGVDRTAQVLGRLARPINEPLLGRIGESDPALSDALRRRMVTFTDLGMLDDRSIQTLLKSIERPTLLSALRGADSTMRELFLRNMSTRAASDLREEIELMAPLPRSQVQLAQEEIVQTVMRLSADGSVRLFTSGDELV